MTRPSAPVSRLAARSFAFLLVLVSAGVQAGETRLSVESGAAELVGRVLDADGSPVPGLTILAEGTPGTPPAQAQSLAPNGAFRLPGLAAPGRYQVSLLLNGSPVGTSLQLELKPGQVADITLTFSPSFLEAVTVSDSRAITERRVTPVLIASIDRGELAQDRPTHPAEVLGRIAGVWVNQTSGEGHMTAIRQPLTTNAVYLYLEDGVPTRSTGFFNHNALYEVNVPQAESIEVTKGPGSALYGSDALGGVVNVLTRSPFSSPGLEVSGEAGSFGWRRALASANLAGAASAIRVDANLTSSDGFRDATGYRRRSFTARMDTALGTDSYLKTVLTFSDIDQQTAGSSPLARADYFDHPTLNLTPISYRRVRALRLSTEYSRESSRFMWSVIPYARYDSMEILPNWTLAYDPTRYLTENRSLGVLAKVRASFVPWSAELTAGLDVDYSPGGRKEDAIRPSTTVLAGGQKVYSAYAVGQRIYDYDVTYTGLAPYLHLETSPSRRLHLQAGLRLDLASFDYEDRLDSSPTPRYRRPESTTVSYHHMSPKLGLTYDLGRRASLFASYRHAFRVPSESQLFRQGAALDTVGLQPVRAESYELGLRVSPGTTLSLEASAFRLEKRDDILSFRDPVDGATQVVNAGRTAHEGVELQASANPVPWLRAAVAWSVVRHTYASWVVDPGRGIDYSGNEMEAAPRQIGWASLTLSPRLLRDASVSFEWTHLGSYFMDAANTHAYGGHDLLNLRASAPLGGGLRAWVQVRNLADRRFADTASYTQARGEELAPGSPRAVMAGVELVQGWR